MALPARENATSANDAPAGPETDILASLCDVALQDYTINKELLGNWLAELGDVARDAHLLDSAVCLEIILLFPQSLALFPFQTLHKDALVACIAAADALDDDVYLDFKLIVHQVILRATTAFYTAKIQLCRVGFVDDLVDGLAAYVQRTENFLSLLLERKLQLLLAFLELGCNVANLKKLVCPLFAASSRVSQDVKQRLFGFLSAALTTHRTQFPFSLFNNFIARPISIPFNNEARLLRCFTVFAWFKINSLPGSQHSRVDSLPLTFLLLANSSNAGTPLLKLQLANSKFLASIHNRETRLHIQFTFNQSVPSHSVENSGFCHLALSYDKYHNLNLYLDGEYSESIPCPMLSKADLYWNKIYIGLSADDAECLLIVLTRDELLVKDLTVLDVPCNVAWIKLIYLLGIEFNWTQKDYSDVNVANLINNLLPRDFVKLSFDLRESLSKNQFENFRGSMVPKALNRSSDVHGQDTPAPDKKTVIAMINKLKFKKANILFDSEDAEFIEFIEKLKNAEIVYHKPASIYDSLYCWGGSGLLLTLVEFIMKDVYESRLVRDTLFLSSIRLLLLFPENNWRLRKEFENLDGYLILMLFLNYYKDNYNASLSFSQEQDPISQTEEGLTTASKLSANGPLDIFLSYSTGLRGSLSGLPVISDPLAFKILVLNFDVYCNTVEFENLSYHLTLLLQNEGYKSHNARELNKMRILRRLIQHTKVCLLGTYHLLARSGEISTLFEIILSFDVSVESIKSITQFVVFALYNDTLPDEAREIGLGALKALTNQLCDSTSTIKLLRKFSRSITIHWILLLLSFNGPDKQFSSRVVCCAIALLARFLAALGPHIVKRFFKSSKGLEVLSYFLQSWWRSDAVVSSLFIASFGVGGNILDMASSTLPQLVQDKKLVQPSRTLPLPDFILVINNLALTGVIQLGDKQGQILSVPSSPQRASTSTTSPENEVMDLSFDIFHLVNQISGIVEVGYQDVPALRHLFLSKEWLEGIFELIAHLRILPTHSSMSATLKSAFAKCYSRLAGAVSGIFISKLLNNREFVSILRGVNDITTKLIFETIFPLIFQHINDFLSNSNFIFKEKDFMRTSTELIITYYSDYISLNFHVSLKNLDIFITSTIAIIETSELDKRVLEELGPILGSSLVFKLVGSGQSQLKAEGLGENELADFIAKVKFCLEKQVLFFQPLVFNELIMRQVIELIFGNYLRFDFDQQARASEHIFNFLRIISMMRQDTLPSIIDHLSELSDYEGSPEILRQFFDFLTTRNDEETARYIQRNPTLRHVISKNYQFRVSKLTSVGTRSIFDMVQVVLKNGGALASLNNIQLQHYEKDCQSLKQLCVHNELVKFNREIQDQQENTTFFSASYNSLKIEIQRLLAGSPLGGQHYMLDFIEGPDRMRRLLVVEDHLPDSERLTYSVNVPVKPVGDVETRDLIQEDLFLHSRLSDLSLVENFAQGADLEDYEEIDERGEIVSSENSRPYEDRNRKVLRSLFLGDQIQNLFNVSRINGLDAVESLMILGFSHIYFIENYFYCTDGNVVDIDEAPQELRDPYLQLIKPNSSSAKNYRNRHWRLENLGCVSKRKFLLRDVALELFFTDGASLLLTCLSTSQRNQMYGKLLPYATGKGLDRDFSLALEISTSSLQSEPEQSSVGSLFRLKFASAFSNGFSSNSAFLELTRKWKLGKTSNFSYLMSVNTMAGRTFNDLTQYPVFPWVLADYHSEKLDLSDPLVFRDLSKPMGAQSAKRAREFQDRFDALASLKDNGNPPFHYGTHYSSAMIVASYLMRMKPHVQSYLLLQGGKFDHADRLFYSVEKAYASASEENTTDVRELTPEFFYLPEFLTNQNNFEFGIRQNGDSINDVILPKWANGDPKIFIAKNREALESPFVSANLHKWIDLVFGYKQNGVEAERALNVFHHLSYDGAINLDNIKDDLEKRAVIGMINNFGQTPVKLFTKPHPAREFLNLPNLYMSLNELSLRTIACTFESKLGLPICKLEVSSKTKKWIGRPTCTSSEDELLIRKPSPNQSKIGCGSLIINQTLSMNLHLTNITCVLQLGNKYFMTGSEDGTIHVWKCAIKPMLNVSFHAILRGHMSEIRSLVSSRTFNVCLSVDAEGTILLWDTSRFKFVRRIAQGSSGEKINRRISISNDSGNFCVVESTKYSSTLKMYTLNGEFIAQTSLNPGNIKAMAMASINDSLVDLPRSDYRHSYWSNELVAVCNSSQRKTLHIYELQVGSTSWELLPVQTIELDKAISAPITSMQVFKQAELDDEEKLTRGRLQFVLGDAKGRVHLL